MKALRIKSIASIPNYENFQFDIKWPANLCKDCSLFTNAKEDGL